MADTILWPKLAKFLRDYPDIKVEIMIDYGLTDIVAQRYDAGVRSGEQVAKDMIAVRIGPDMRMAVVGAPSYFRKRSEPKKPQDLIGHNCINLRLPTHGGLYAWEFEKGGRELKVRVEGQLVFNSTNQMLNAALAGFGMAYVPEDLVQPHLAKGRLKRVLEDWCPPYSGYHLLLPKPTPVLGGLCPAGRCATLSRQIVFCGIADPRPRFTCGGAHFGFAPSIMGTASISLRDLTIFSVVDLKSFEMRSFQMRLVRILIGIDFKNSDAGGIIFFRHGI